MNLKPKAAIAEAHPPKMQLSLPIIKAPSLSVSKVEKTPEIKEGKQFGISGNLKLLKREGKKVFKYFNSVNQYLKIKKVSRTKAVSLFSSTDLPLKLLPDGANILSEAEKLLKKKLAKKVDTLPVTQEVCILLFFFNI